MNSKILLRTIWSGIKQNSTKILAAGAIISEMFGFYLMHKEAPIVRDKLDALGPEATWKDKLKTAGPVYIPAALMLITSSACIISGCAIGDARTAMVAGLYSLSERKLRKYEEKMVDVMGEEKAQKLHDEVAKELESKPFFEEKSVEYTSHGGQLFFDPLTSRFFTSTETYIRKAVEEINTKIFGVDMWVSVNEWYDALGISHAKLAGAFGWDIDHKLEISFAPAKTETGVYYGILVYYNKPRLRNGELPANYGD